MHEQDHLIPLIGLLSRLLPMRLTDLLMGHVFFAQEPIDGFEIGPTALRLLRQGGAGIVGDLFGYIHQALGATLISQGRPAKSGCCPRWCRQ